MIFWCAALLRLATQSKAVTRPQAVFSLAKLRFCKQFDSLIGVLQPGYKDIFGKGRTRQRRGRRRPGEGQQAQQPAGQGTASPQSASHSPLRNLPYLGGLIPLSSRGELACPRAVIAMRAAVARLPPVQSLRPQALSIRLMCIGAQLICQREAAQQTSVLHCSCLQGSCLMF